MARSDIERRYLLTVLDRYVGEYARSRENLKRMLSRCGPELLDASRDDLGGITQRELAERLEITDVWLSNLRTGKADFSLEVAEKLAALTSRKAVRR